MAVIYSKKSAFASFLIFIILIFLSSCPSSADEYFELTELDERKDGFYIMKDLQTKEIIMRTARIIHPGDEYINSENKLYRVEKIEGDIAWAHFIENIKLLEINIEEVFSPLSGRKALEISQRQQNDFMLGVYHSHGAESYVPSDGTESIPQGGGILDVGRAFSEALQEKGLNVKYSQRTHVPHDANAYNRSRRTAEEFIREGANSLFDIHRDAVPAEEYIEIVGGRPTVQLQLVVGRQNQNAQVNRNFAESLKKVTDDLYPGLIKGIFLARGNYNQDMLPLAMLVEVGSHENTKEGAQRSMALFSDAVATYFLGREGQQAREGIGMTALRSILWIILIVGAALGIYLLLGTKNLEELRAKLTHFFKREFSELKGKKNGEGE